MKRFLKQTQYRQTDTEREALWHAVRRQTHGPAGRPTRTPVGWRPTATLAAVAAMVTLMAVWHVGSRQILERPLPGAGGGADVAYLAPTRSDQLSDARAEEPGPAGDEPRVGKERSEAAPRDRDVAAPTAKSAPAPATSPPATAAPQDVAPGRALAEAPAAAEVEAEDTAEVAAEVEAKVRTEATLQASADRASSRNGPVDRPALSGRITDRASGRPLAGVLVLVRGTALSARTDSLGVYRFPTLPAGVDIELSVRAPGYDPRESRVDLAADGTAVRDLTLMRPAVVARLQGPSRTERDAAETLMGRLESKGSAGAAGGRPVPMSATPPARLERIARESYGMRAPGSVTGGTTPPNGEPFELMYFENVGVNPFVATEDDALSTFAVDVDDASWTMTRSYLRRGHLPPRDAIRVEEFVNAFDAGWPRLDDQPLRIHTEGAPSRFGGGYHLLRIGIVGRTVEAAQRRPTDLVFVVDVSGSMAREARLDLVKRALRTLLDELQEGDRVGIVTYGSRGEVALPLTGIAAGGRQQIATVVERLRTGGSTNAAEGLELAYAMARDALRPGTISRLILCSDGVANTGASTEAEGILARVRRESDEGISLSAVGFGMGNYNDVLMEKLADRGDGNYAYVDTRAAAERVFRENLTGRLQTVAREVKVQVEFDPRFVRRWRLLGYENRDVADDDFRNDAVDAGEVGAGHQVTALYELKLIRPDGDGSARTPAPGPAVPLGTVRVRYEAPVHDTPRAGEVTEIAQPILRQQFTGDAAAATPWMQVQALVAEFAEVLRGSYWAKDNDLAALVPVAEDLAARLPGDPQVRELADLVRLAAAIAAGHEE